MSWMNSSNAYRLRVILLPPYAGLARILGSGRLHCQGAGEGERTLATHCLLV
jgi:hypothetical protein